MVITNLIAHRESKHKSHFISLNTSRYDLYRSVLNYNKNYIDMLMSQTIYTFSIIYQFSNNKRPIPIQIKW